MCEDIVCAFSDLRRKKYFEITTAESFRDNFCFNLVQKITFIHSCLKYIIKAMFYCIISS